MRWPQPTEPGVRNGSVPATGPSHELLDCQFEAAVDPLLAAARRCDSTLRADRLASMRDLLLPKLVTGQIDVSALDLDALVEEAVA